MSCGRKDLRRKRRPLRGRAGGSAAEQAAYVRTTRYTLRANKRQTAVLPQDQDPGCLRPCLARERPDRCPRKQRCYPRIRILAVCALCLARGAAEQMSGAYLEVEGCHSPAAWCPCHRRWRSHHEALERRPRRLPIAPGALRPGARLACRGGGRTVRSGRASIGAPPPSCHPRGCASRLRRRAGRRRRRPSGDRAHHVASVEQLV